MGQSSTDMGLLRPSPFWKHFWGRWKLVPVECEPWSMLTLHELVQYIYIYAIPTYSDSNLPPSRVYHALDPYPYPSGSKIALWRSFASRAKPGGATSSEVQNLVKSSYSWLVGTRCLAILRPVTRTVTKKKHVQTGSVMDLCSSHSKSHPIINS